METPQQLRALYATTPLWLWPVLWLQIRALGRTFERLTAEGYVGVAYHWDARSLRFVITRLDRPNAASPFAALTPSMEYVFAKAGYMPHNLWALTFNTISVFRNTARGIGPVRIQTFAFLEPD